MFNPIAVTLPPALKTKQPRDPHGQRRRARADERGEPRAGRHLHRAPHDEVGGRRREVRDPRGLDAREHAAAAAVGEGRPGELERHARPLPDGPDRRRRRHRLSCRSSKAARAGWTTGRWRGSRSRPSRTSTSKTARKDFIRGYVHERDRRTDRVSALRGEPARLRLGVEEGGEEPVRRAGARLDRRRRDAGAEGQSRRAGSGGEGQVGHPGPEDPLHALRQRPQAASRTSSSGGGAVPEGGRRGHAERAARRPGRIPGSARLARCAPGRRRGGGAARSRSADRSTKSAPRA